MSDGRISLPVVAGDKALAEFRQGLSGQAALEHLAAAGGRLLVTFPVAEEALVQFEADVVVQAVGRVRPFTKPRDIITMHAGLLPGVRYTKEFRKLDEARAYFGVSTVAQGTRAKRDAKIRQLRAKGLKQLQIANEIGISVKTVKRALRGDKLTHNS